MERVHYPHLSREREDEGERNTCTALTSPASGRENHARDVPVRHLARGAISNRPR